jgi:hypothetical protein
MLWHDQGNMETFTCIKLLAVEPEGSTQLIALETINSNSYIPVSTLILSSQFLDLPRDCLTKEANRRPVQITKFHVM